MLEELLGKRSEFIWVICTTAIKQKVNKEWCQRWPTNLMHNNLKFKLNIKCTFLLQ